MNITIFVDKIDTNGLGATINNKQKAEYLLAMTGKSFADILNQTDKSVKIPSGGFGVGQYVVLFNISWDLTIFNFGIINANIDLDINFDAFADSFSPKAVAAFHQLKTELKLKNSSKTVVFSADNFDFEIAYQSYKNSQHHQ